MKPLTLTLKNFHGIRSGMGRDEITVDFAKLAGPGLVALVGANGSGKTTLLDNMHPFRLMPYKSVSAGASYSPRAFSYYDQTYGDAYKELVWRHANVTYKSTIVIRGARKNKKTEAYLEWQQDGAWDPCETNDGTPIDGKTDAYDRAIAELLGPPELYFTSVFACQERRTLASYGNADIKAILSDLLGLSYIRDLGADAHDVAKALRTMLRNMQDDLRRLDATQRDLDALRTRINESSASLTMATQTRFAAVQGVRDATQTLADVRARSVETRDLLENRRKLELAIRALESDHCTSSAQLDKDISHARDTWAEEKARLTAQTVAIAQEVDTLANLVKENESLLANADAIHAAEQLAPELAGKEQATAKALDAAQEALAQHKAHLAEVARLRGVVDALKREGLAIRTTLEGMEKRAGLVKSVPCTGTDMNATCPLLADANQAGREVEQVERNRQAKLAEYRSARNDLEEAEKQAAIGTDAIDAVTRITSDLRSLREHILTNNEIASKAGALNLASEVVANDRKRLDVLAEQRMRIGQSERDGLAAHKQRIAELEARRTEEVRRFDEKRAPLQKELFALPSPYDEEQTEDQRAESALNAAEAALHAAEQRIATLTDDIARLKAEAGVAQKTIDAAGKARAKADRLETEIPHWELLAKSLGNNGVIALSIDDAGPTLSSYANDLLRACYGPRLSVKIVTQREKQDGTLAEDFDIIVYDAERDDEKPFKMISGGEKVWINEAMTRAITLYQAETSQRHYLSLMTDETDGALDEERRDMFFRMKRRMLEIGGFEQEFFISHARPLWESADHVIHVDEL